MAKSGGSRRQIYFWLISVIVVASMVCSFAVTLRPSRQRVTTSTELPTRFIPTWTPTLPLTPTPTNLAVAPSTSEPPQKQPPSSPTAAALPPTATPTAAPTAEPTTSAQSDEAVAEG